MAVQAETSEQLEVEIERVTASVRRRVPASIDDNAVRTVVRERFTAYEDAAIRTFISVLAERTAIERLKDSSGAEG